MARIAIRVLGPLQVTLDGESVGGFHSDKVRALLAYLCLKTERPHRREKLAGLLWPDLPGPTYAMRWQISAR
jgi:DNA-binding SARP family transcriptional activator